MSCSFRRLLSIVCLLTWMSISVEAHAAQGAGPIKFAEETRPPVRPKMIEKMFERPTAIAKPTVTQKEGDPSLTMAKKPTNTQMPPLGGLGGLGGGAGRGPNSMPIINGPMAPGAHNGWGYYNPTNYPTKLDRPRAFSFSAAPITTSTVTPFFGIGVILLLFLV